MRISTLAGVWLDIVVTMAWEDWMAKLCREGGILLNNGFIPLHALNMVMHVAPPENAAPPTGDNIIQMPKKP